MKRRRRKACLLCPLLFMRRENSLLRWFQLRPVKIHLTDQTNFDQAVSSVPQRRGDKCFDWERNIGFCCFLSVNCEGSDTSSSCSLSSSLLPHQRKMGQCTSDPYNTMIPELYLDSRTVELTIHRGVTKIIRFKLKKKDSIRFRNAQERGQSPCVEITVRVETGALSAVRMVRRKKNR